MLVAVTAVLGVSLIWLSAEILRQDGIVANQQRAERLEADADRVLRLLERHLADAEGALQALAEEGPQATTWPTAGTVVHLTSSSVDLIAGRPLLFQPVTPAAIEPQPEVFVEANVAEYGRRDFVSAAQAYRRLVASGSPSVRAAAWLGLGRVLRAAGQPAEALRAYGDMASLESVRVVGLPADLVARDAAAELLAQIGRPDDARLQAKAIVSDLEASKWMLGAGQYEHYLERAAVLAGIPAPTEGLVASRAVDALWHRWHSDLPPRGRVLERDGATSVLLVWAATNERLTAWVIDAAAFLRLVPAEPGVAVSLGDEIGVVAGRTDGTGRPVVRTGPDSRLPWTLQMMPDGPASPAVDPLRSRFVLGGLVAMLLVLVGGAIAIGRVVQRERGLAEAQSDFVAAVSHEFRTPLAAMRQLSEMLSEGRVEDAAQRAEYYQSLAGESRRLQRLVENLLNVGRLDAGDAPYRQEPADPQVLLGDVISEYRAELAARDCHIDVTSGTPAGARLLVDREAVALAVHNLIDNAVKYSGGRPVRVSWDRFEDGIAIRVRDEGPGIPEEEQRRIFRRFVRGSAAQSGRIRGTGLGLAMVQLVAERHGGRVTVESAPGAGATFTLVLPAVRTSSRQAAAEEATT